MRVYRVEWGARPAVAHGPYRAWMDHTITPEEQDALYELRAKLLKIPTTPGPWDDHALNGIERWEVCSFISIWQLARWFDGFLETLDEHGFVMREYEVGEQLVRIGKTQCLANPNDMQLLGETRLVK